MADQPKSDMVMQFQLKGGTPVNAECALEKDPSDTFMDGFNPATYQNYSDFFEIQKFDFGFEVKDQDKSKKSTSGTGQFGAPSNSRSGSSTTGTPRTGSGLVAGQFASWRSANQNEAPNVLFPLEFEKFSFERLIDGASPIFFNYCVASKSFDKAILVKRVSIGGDNIASGYLRIEFSNVLITKLDWDDGDMTTEKCDFICRDVQLKYRQLKNDGSWGTTAPASWNYQKNALPDR